MLFRHLGHIAEANLICVGSYNDNRCCPSRCERTNQLAFWCIAVDSNGLKFAQTPQDESLAVRVHVQYVLLYVKVRKQESIEEPSDDGCRCDNAAICTRKSRGHEMRGESKHAKHLHRTCSNVNKKARILTLCYSPQQLSHETIDDRLWRSVARAWHFARPIHRRVWRIHVENVCQRTHRLSAQSTLVDGITCHSDGIWSRMKPEKIRKSSGVCSGEIRYSERLFYSHSLHLDANYPHSMCMVFLSDIIRPGKIRLMNVFFLCTASLCWEQFPRNADSCERPSARCFFRMPGKNLVQLCYVDGSVVFSPVFPKCQGSYWPFGINQNNACVSSDERQFS